jgi:hypothetical protein
MMNKSAMLLLLALLVGLNVQAQRELKEMDADREQERQRARSNHDWMEKVRFGGNIGASFGSSFSSVLLQPMVFYQLTEKSMPGIGVTYIYWSQKYQVSPTRTESFSDNVFGFNAFFRQVLFEQVFAHAEYNPMNFTRYNPNTRSESRVWQHALYLGGGLQQEAGRGGFYFMALYDVLWNANSSFYPTPWDFRMGFYF